MNNKFKTIREQRGLSQMQMATTCGVSIPIITALEKDRLDDPYPSTRRKLAEGYGLAISEIPGSPKPDALPSPDALTISQAAS